jgi:hypothetical protein
MRGNQGCAAGHDSLAGLPEAGLEEHLQLRDETLDRLHAFSAF